MEGSYHCPCKNGDKQRKRSNNSTLQGLFSPCMRTIQHKNIGNNDTVIGGQDSSSTWNISASEYQLQQWKNGMYT